MGSSKAADGAYPRGERARGALDLEAGEHKRAKQLALDLDAPSLLAVIRALLELAREDQGLQDRLTFKPRQPGRRRRITLDLEVTERKRARQLSLDLDAPSLAALIRALLELAHEDPGIRDRLSCSLSEST